jgi:hypothetical protein
MSKPELSGLATGEGMELSIERNNWFLVVNRVESLRRKSEYYQEIVESYENLTGDFQAERRLQKSRLMGVQKQARIRRLKNQRARELQLRLRATMETELTRLSQRLQELERDCQELSQENYTQPRGGK